MSETSKTATLKALMKEAMKEYCTYDANGLIEYVYQAPADTADGGVCLVTRYGYNASNKPLRMKESLGTWDSDYDFS